MQVFSFLPDQLELKWKETKEFMHLSMVSSNKAQAQTRSWKQEYGAF